MPISDNPDPTHVMTKIAKYRDGEGKRRSIQCLDLRAAELEIAMNAEPGRDLRAVSCGTVTEWFGKKQTTRGYIAFRHHMAWLERLFVKRMEGRAFSSLTVKDCNAIIDAMKDEDGSKKTIRMRRYLLQSLVNSAQLRGFIDFNPMRIANKSMPRLAPASYERPSDEEVASVRLHAFPMSSALVELACEGGVELKAVGRLRWEDFDFREARFKVPGPCIGEIAGGERFSRHVPMSGRLVASLLRWRLHSGRRSGLVFPTRDGRPLSSVQVLGIINDVQVAAELLAQPKPVKPRSSRSKGTTVRSLKPGRPYQPGRGRYTWTAFQFVAGVNWARTEGLKVVSERMGIAVSTAQERYQGVFDQALSEQVVMTLSFAPEYF